MTTNLTDLQNTLIPLIQRERLEDIAMLLGELDADEVTGLLERLPANQQAVVFRLLPKDRAIAVFERFDPGHQGDLVKGLRAAEVTEIFAGLEPDDRAWLLEELPAGLTAKMLHGLTPSERQMTADVLGYPKGSIGRRMSPEYVATRTGSTVAETMARVRAGLDEAETIYTLPVLDETRHVMGVVSLRDLLRAEPDTVISQIMSDPVVATAYDTDEEAARRTADLGLLAMPIVDLENRLVGILTIDDAARILEFEETEDSSRQGGVEPLRRPYFATPIRRLVSSRIIWLLVLALGAALTVQVLSVFEDTLAQVTTLALFVPLLIGTGGNTGNQAATTVTRALALGDVGTRDVRRVFTRELAVGFSLGIILGFIGFLIVGLLFGFNIGLVIGLTIASVCSLAATIGGIMPIVARLIRVDPAVFSNPFITTFVDATGLILYFLIAKAVLGI
ncbi:magnesium transporter [Flaviflexus salsibiostraticola]|uniref:Magnesium transporter MgtE n=1 Tax=Flaviflexus salsibiostraticola TaxID=1282737 RepID=A0A3S8Z6A4_9ACTO|nr:magnesium transporter [Flaviflexus salsibiostraticola]AZN29032.1 magnesium transporter [Flaviflexus salsibiostraticola]